jgi:hypothetical protein
MQHRLAHPRPRLVPVAHMVKIDQRRNQQSSTFHSPTTAPAVPSNYPTERSSQIPYRPLQLYDRVETDITDDTPVMSRSVRRAVALGRRGRG